MKNSRDLNLDRRDLSLGKTIRLTYERTLARFDIFLPEICSLSSLINLRRKAMSLYAFSA